MIRKTAILLLALVLIGCGSTNDQAAGTTSQAAAQEAAAADSEGTAQQAEENGEREQDEIADREMRRQHRYLHREPELV